MNPKQRAGEAAIQFIHDHMVIGLGTGSTADYFLLTLAAALQSGHIHDIVGVPTSRQSERRAIELHIPLTTLAAHPQLDLTVDGADEIDPHLDLIKGGGGALIREKIVAQNSARLLIIADASKRVPTLGSTFALPVEVIPFSHEAQVPFLTALGCTPVLRPGQGDQPFVTDNGNYIYDCRFPNGIATPADVENRILHRAGILGCGLFLNMTSVAVIGAEDHVEILQKQK